MIYFDNAATTPLLPCVKEDIAKVLDVFGNPSSVHCEGVKAQKLLELSRKTIAKCLNCEPDEIIFTSGGSESNALALSMNEWPLLTSNIEHHSILENYNVKSFSTVFCDPEGYIQPKEFQRRIENNHIVIPLASIMMTNNEIGTEQAIPELAAIAHENNVIFHTDAVASVGYQKIDLKGEHSNVDMMSFSGHKFGALKGIGGLYVKREIQNYLSPVIYGGLQEFGLRAGTENVIGAVSMASALKHMTDNMDKWENNLFEMMVDIITSIQMCIPQSHINGRPGCHSHILNARFDGVDGESLVLALSAAGVCVSSKSACASKDGTPSHVLKAIGLTDEKASSSIRISLGIQNTMEECMQFVQILKTTVEELRSLK